MLYNEDGLLRLSQPPSMGFWCEEKSPIPDDSGRWRRCHYGPIARVYPGGDFVALLWFALVEGSEVCFSFFCGFLVFFLRLKGLGLGVSGVF